MPKKVNNYKMAYKPNKQLNFRRIFVNMDILRSSDYSNTETYPKILHSTARGWGGGGGGLLSNTRVVDVEVFTLHISRNFPRIVFKQKKCGNVLPNYYSRKIA